MAHKSEPRLLLELQLKKKQKLNNLLNYLDKIIYGIGYVLMIAVVYLIYYFTGKKINWLYILGFALYPGFIGIFLIHGAIDVPIRNHISKMYDAIVSEEPVQEEIRTIEPFTTVSLPELKEPSIKAPVDIIEPLSIVIPEPEWEIPITSKQRAKSSRTSIKTDYRKLNEKRHHIGITGELFALDKVKEGLMKEGLHHYLEKVEHVSLIDDTLGYDIISYSQDGKQIFIEVKATTENSKAAFYLTDTELQAMRELDNYFIYRIYDLDVENREGNYFIIDCKKDIHKHYQLEAISYRVSPII